MLNINFASLYMRFDLQPNNMKSHVICNDNVVYVISLVGPKHYSYPELVLALFCPYI